MEAEAPNNTLKKKERLCGKTAVSKLLADGRHGNVSGFHFIYLAENGHDFSRLLISVPKKIFKRAVKRNLYKRRIRESWRRQKHTLEVNADILIRYSTKDQLTYEDVYKGIGEIIERLNSLSKKERTNEKVAE